MVYRAIADDGSGKEGVHMEKSMDMINGSLGDKIIKYAIPLAVTGVLQQLFNAADLAVVGNFSGKEAMAAVGSNAPVIGLLLPGPSVRKTMKIFQRQYIHQWSWHCWEECFLRC